MIIVAGRLRVPADERARYLALVADVTSQARRAPGCLRKYRIASVEAP